MGNTLNTIICVWLVMWLVWPEYIGHEIGQKWFTFVAAFEEERQ